jgi:hypothetical protein
MRAEMTPIDIGYQAIENALCMFALRDEFAAKALQGMMADSQIRQSWEAFATDAYDAADAMLKARERVAQ